MNQIFGGLGSDTLNGDAGNDNLYANNLANTDDSARDLLIGGIGTDSAFGRLLDLDTPSPRFNGPFSDIENLFFS
jgi:Ca2+-binding RTX toxin-like protein